MGPPASAINSMSKISKTQASAEERDFASLLQAGLRRLASADVSMQESCCRTLMRVLQNVESSPKDPKFRQLNRENKALASKVFAVPGAEEFLIDRLAVSARLPRYVSAGGGAFGKDSNLHCQVAGAHGTSSTEACPGHVRNSSLWASISV